MIEKDKVELAIEEFNKAYEIHLAGQIESAIELYKKSIDLFPTSKAHTFLGWAYSLKGKFEEAIEECYKAIDIDPEFGNPYNDIGSYLISLGRHSEAISWLEKAIDSPNYEPRHYPFYNLGIVYEKIGDWFVALRYYKDAVEIYPEYDAAKTAVIRMTSLLN